MKIDWPMFLVLACCVIGHVIPEASSLFWSCVLLVFLNNVVKV